MPYAANLSSPTGMPLVWNETPSGAVDGNNSTFALAYTPSPASALMFFKDGILQRAGSGNDFTITGNTITFESGSVPLSGSILLATYPH